MNLTELLMERLSDRECSRCGRRLTDPASIEDGIGPVCKSTMRLPLITVLFA